MTKDRLAALQAVSPTLLPTKLLLSFQHHQPPPLWPFPMTHTPYNPTRYNFPEGVSPEFLLFIIYITPVATDKHPGLSSAQLLSSDMVHHGLPILNELINSPHLVVIVTTQQRQCWWFIADAFKYFVN